MSLASMQVDVANRLGASTTSTTTGFATLDAWTLGGLRNGSLFALSGGPGLGKTAFLLLLSYMAARTRAAVLFVSAALDETEIVARLAARALYREYPESQTAYGAIWSGEAWQDESTREAVGTCVDLAISKVGQFFHLYRARPFESVTEITSAAAQLWARHERVSVFVDGVEALSSSAGADSARSAAVNGDLANRMTQVGYELRQLADGGCAVVVTSELANAHRLLPSATLAAKLVPAHAPLEPLPSRDRILGGQGIDLMVTKNTVGPRGVIPLKFIAGGAVFEEVLSRRAV